MSKKTQDFHIIITETMYREIKEIAAGMKTSMSGAVIFLFKCFLPFGEKHQLKAKERDSKYELIGDKNEKRYHLHVYLPLDSYRKIKQIHVHLNYYSMAQILRLKIKFFIMGIKKFGMELFLEKLKNIKKLWKEMKEKYRKEKRIFRKPLVYKDSKITDMVAVYTDHHSPYTFQFLEVVVT
jgi:hypothetical protein